ncbi:hypothetical protein DOTSEDRAFT_27170 [Dothistroma septosporum NZE10]|uniref:Uncharacterized protein n=1 Tax=Dothistroma septosporum (strain NZE10 / CBS 128990) TaxID=675120 RepID=N1PEI8_DOTSN|nr:hypothetical protein DOTSEDRAFT_27170 [Dothistroma septosporum NZE10]
MHTSSRDRTPANVVNGREDELFMSPSSEVKTENADIEDDMRPRRAEKRPAQTISQGSASKRQRTGDRVASGTCNFNPTAGRPAEIIDLEDGEVPNRGPPNAASSSRAQQPAQRNRTVSSQQPRPAPSVDLTSDENVITFQILNKDIQTMTTSKAFSYVKSRMEKIFIRRSRRVLNDNLESTLKVMAHAVSNPKSAKAFILTTYRTTWKKKLQDAVKYRKDQYDKVVRLQDEHDWDADVERYGRDFVKPKLKLYEEAKQDFQIVEELIEVMKSI